jgi:hypothetical protein
MGQTKPVAGKGATKPGGTSVGSSPVYQESDLAQYANADKNQVVGNTKSTEFGTVRSQAQQAQEELDRRKGLQGSVDPLVTVPGAAPAVADVATRALPTVQERAGAGPITQVADPTKITRGSTGPLSA